jgi:hypothetical protein
MQPDDIKCDVANTLEGLHPHMTAPAIANYLNSKGYNPSNYKFFTITREPLEMLWSYYKFFEPDLNSRYNFQSRHEAKLALFEDWLLNGRVGLCRLWMGFVPPYVSDKDLSPLSLDAHVLDASLVNYCTKIFKFEDRKMILEWLSKVFGETISDKHVNISNNITFPKLHSETVIKLQEQLRMDFEFYRD